MAQLTVDRVSTVVIGRPGRYSAAQGRANGIRALGWNLLAALGALVVVLMAGLVLRALVAGSGIGAHVTAGVVAAILAALARSKAAGLSAQAGRQQRGTQSEVDVVNALKRAGVSLIINGAELHAGGDADHVVAHQRGYGQGVLAVVETKSGGGLVRFERGRLLSGKASRPIPGDPISQAARQAKALSRYTGRPVAAVVCVPAMTSNVFTVEDVVVCGTEHLSDLFHHGLPQSALDTAAVQALADNIRPKD